MTSEDVKFEQADILLGFCFSVIFSDFKAQERALIINHYKAHLPNYPSLFDAGIVDKDGWYLIAGERVKQLERKCVARFEALVHQHMTPDVLAVLRSKSLQNNSFAIMLDSAWGKKWHLHF